MANIVSWLMNPIGNLLNLFNTSNDGGSTIWNHNNGYQGNSFTEQGNQNAGNFGLDPDGMVSGLWNDWMGFTSQSREFSQQEYLQDKMNLYNTPLNQMKRMKEAGINPNTAAAGISQGGNESVQAPAVASNQGGVAQGVSSAASMISGLGEVAQVASVISKNQAETDNLQANTKSTLDLLSANKGLIRMQTYLAYKNAGVADLTAKSLEIENTYRGENMLLDIAAKRLQLPILRQTFRNLRKEYDLKVQTIKNLEQEVLESGSRISLNEAQAFAQRKLGLQLEADTWYQNQINQTMANFNFDPRWSSNSVMFGVATDLNISDEEAQRRFDALLDNTYSVSYYDAAARGQVDLDKGVGLIQAQEEATKRINKEQRKGEFWNKTADKWIRVPSSASVGPFSMSTQ